MFYFRLLVNKTCYNLLDTKVIYLIVQVFRYCCVALVLLMFINRVLKRESRVVLLCGAKLKDALLTSITELFSSQAHTSCSPCADPLRTSVNPEDIDSPHTELQKCKSDFTCSPNRESCPCDTLKLTDKSSDYKDGSLECEAHSMEKTTTDSVNLNSCDLEVKTDHQDVLCGTEGLRTLNDVNEDDAIDGCHSSNISTVSSAFDELTPLNKSTLDMITRLCRRSSNTFANRCPSHNCSTISRNIWVTELVHYVKLGDTHAFMCVFSTKKFDV